MEEVEIPQYFICPISLQIMKDPVTAITGITYDRESIEHWLKTARDTTCPVTNQPLPRDLNLTPNHTLRRLIQAWCVLGRVERIPTPRSPLNKQEALHLIDGIGNPNLCMKSLLKLEALATENESNKKCLAEAGIGEAMVSLTTKCFKEGKTIGLEECLRILHLVWSSSSDEIKPHVKENNDFVDSLTWVLGCKMDNHATLRTYAVLHMKQVTEVATTSLLERLKPELFKGIVRVLKDRISQQATKAALQVLIEACPWGRNRLKIVEANAVFELIELEFEKPEKNITEFIFNLLAQLCSCADGRAEFLNHAGGLAMLSKRILRVSPATNDGAVHILGLITKFSATNEVLSEMLRVGVVSKLCMVIQADCAPYLKERARLILRLHSNVWNNSPCIAVYLLTWQPR
ncbi:E3 ubiquitin-protein ligase PUB24-like [Tripterygium wilfordii]|uniref:U-box domain-containing protein n=1 Tax=Tripterygium wilfordii TaxID=458696 RepID=A0A7J7DF39_TRIWF|nr:E3 ubiquitin-protein ligase PUB23-like [Tripterygium wilfordii]KAF5744921.1 E3 ubiquitin-protein ligase PUB24-like [Tripterygium wilfordii]